jgi:hypothetical protein
MPRFLVLSALLLSASLPLQAAIVTGPEIQVTSAVLEPPAFSQWYGRLASNGTDFLAVWNESASGTQAVHAARVSSDGKRIDDVPLVVADSDRNDWQPDVAWGNGRYLIVWTTDYGSVFARFVGPDLTAAEPFRLSTGANDTQPRVIWNGSAFLIVWRAGDGTRGVIADANGSVTANVHVPSAYAPPEMELATANGSFFVVTSVGDYTAPPMDPGPAARVVITRIETDGRNAERSEVTAADAFVADLRTASNIGEVRVAWTSIVNGTNTIRSVGLTAAGPGQVESLDAGSMRVEALIADRGDFLLVYGNAESHFVRDTRSATPLVLPMAPRSRVMAAASGAAGAVEIVVVEPPDRSSTTPFGWDLYAQRLGHSEIDPLALAARHQTAPHIARSGSMRLAAWAELVEDGTRLAIMATRLGPDSIPLDTNGIDLGATLRFGYSTVLRVAGGAGQWLVVWHDGNALYGARVAANGTVLDAEPLVVASDIYYSNPFSVEWDGSRYLVAFTRGVPTRYGGSYQVLAVRVGADGVVESPEIAVSESGPNAAPSIAIGPEGALVVWTSRYVTSLTYAVRGALVTRSGSVTPIAFPSPEHVVWDGVAAAWNGTTFLVAAPYGATIRFFTVTASGTVREAQGTIPLQSPLVRLELQPLGDQFVLAWAVEDGIHAATLNSGGFVTSGDTLVAGPSRYESVRRFGLSGGMLAYSRDADPLRARLTRVFVRELVAQPNPPKRRAA